MEHRSSLRKRLTAIGAVLALTVSGLLVSTAVAPLASAAPAPVQQTDSGVVSAQALPTVQVDGVVWSQTIVGNTAYAGGKFNNARPAGAAAGTNQTPRANLLAYNLTTGELITSFNPVLNGQVRFVKASPDGSRLYVGGDFTTVNGASRSRIVALNPATGAVINEFLAAADYNVYSIAATNTTVYIGGDFNSARGVARKKLAAFNAADGALLGWNPGADNRVNAVLLSPDGTKIIAGGAFGNAAGKANYGMAAINATTGASMTWNASSLVRDAGKDSAILGLSTDGTNIYGNGYVFGGGGNLEGTFSADPANGNIRWIEDCHGDSYGTFASTSAVYVVSHAHYCGNVGGHPQTDPWTFQRAMAFTKNPTGTLNADPLGYFNFGGNPSPSIIGWFPELAIGSVTGQSQAAWTVTGNDQYVLLGGEFPRVNGAGQQGIARFAVKPISTGMKPVLAGANFVPSISAMGPGSIRATVQTNWDRDDTVLTYELLRDGKVVSSTQASSTFWNRPNVTLSDTGLTSGTAYKYQLRAVDSAGNNAVGNQVTYNATSSAPAPSAYSSLVRSQGASAYWRLGEPSGTVFDWAGTNDGSAQSGMTRNVAGAVTGDPNTAATFNGTDSGRMYSKTSMAGPNTFTTEAWIKTTTTTGGKIVGFAQAQSGTSGSNYDRHLYMDNAGKVYFGVFPNAIKTVSSPTALNDGQWHQLVGSLGAGGMALYVDGVKVGQDPTVTQASAYSGYWRIGGDQLASWTSTPTSKNFNGTIDEVSIYPTALTDQQVLDQFKAAGGQLPNVAPTAAFASTTTGLTANVDASTSTDTDGTISSYAWDFGDSATGTGKTASHAYAAAGTFQVKLTVTDNRGGTNVLTKPVTVTAPPPNQLPTPLFTVTQTNLSLAVDATTSTDSDGTISTYAWNFGDTTTGTGVKATHNFATPGTYQVTLTVTDNAGGSKTLTQPVTATAPPVNKAPVAAFTSTSNGATAAVDASTSTDPDGTISSYAWDFGDSSTGTGKNASRTYAASGTYHVKLTVTDDKGATNDVTHDVTVTVPPVPNQAPVAAFSSTPTDLAVAFDASASKDTDGSISSYAWDFGDSATGTGVTTAHTYGAAGTFQVKLTVTDDKGATTVTQSPVTVTAPAANEPPVAAFTTSAANLKVSVDGTSSSDPDGTISTYAWDFGDGATATTATATHTYAAAGTHQITLKVTDNKGTSTSLTKPVDTQQAANVPPVALFTSTTTDLTANLNAGDANDPDGSITTYAWDFGDSATGSGATTSHAYAAGGTYQVKLTVTDNNGAVTSVTNPVTVAPAPAAVFASDQFARTVASGWGTADQGGAWTLDGSTPNFLVGGGVGTIKMATAGSGKAVWMNGVSQTNVDTTVDFALDKAATGGGTTVSVAARRIGTSDYRLRVRANAGGSVAAELTRVINGTETAIATQTVSGLTYNVGDTLRMRFQVNGTGTATLQGKVWKVGGTEPAAWQVSKTDTTAALQAAGGIGLVTYVSGSATNAPVAATFDNMTVKAIQ